MPKKSPANRCQKLAERIFFDRYNPGDQTVPFSRDERPVTAKKLEIELPKNLETSFTLSVIASTFPILSVKRSPRVSNGLSKGSGRPNTPSARLPATTSFPTRTSWRRRSLTRPRKSWRPTLCRMNRRCSRKFGVTASSTYFSGSSRTPCKTTCEPLFGTSGRSRSTKSMRASTPEDAISSCPCKQKAGTTASPSFKPSKISGAAKKNILG